MLAFLVALSLAGEAPAASVIREAPGWAGLPSSADIGQVYPPAALAQRVGGKATIACRVNADGTLSECAAVAEKPAGMGFGDAALKLVPLFRMQVKPGDALVEGGRVRIPITFRP